MKKALMHIAGALALVSAASVASANLVSNGSFESFVGTLRSDGGLRVDPLSPAIAGWSVVGPGNIALGSTPNSYNAYTPFGITAADLTGYGSESAFNRATLSQTIAGLMIGQEYQLSFWLGLIDGRCGDGGNGNCDGPNGATVSIAGASTQSSTFSVSVGSAQPGRLSDSLPALVGAGTLATRIWDPFTYTFTADASTIQLGFQATQSTANNAFLGLDNVALTTVVPLPAAGWLLLSGFGLLTWLQRRRG